MEQFAWKHSKERSAFRWTTADGREFTFDTLTDEHLSNIYTHMWENSLAYIMAYGHKAAGIVQKIRNELELRGLPVPTEIVDGKVVDLSRRIGDGS